MVPLLRKIDVKIGFRPEGLSPKPAVTAAKAQVAAFSERVDPTAAADTVDIFRHEAGFRRTFSNEPEPIGITGNLHFRIPTYVALDPIPPSAVALLPKEGVVPLLCRRNARLYGI